MFNQLLQMAKFAMMSCLVSGVACLGTICNIKMVEFVNKQNCICKQGFYSDTSGSEKK